jgi:type II secretory pathway component PulF
LDGVGLIESVIFLAVAIYVEAAILPGALTSIATTALTSVNTAVINLFQILTPIIAVVVTVLLYIRIVRSNIA